MTEFKPFYNEYLAQTKEAREELGPLYGDLAALFDDAVGEGYSPRDIGSHMVQLITLIEASAVARHALALHKEREGE